MIKQNDIDTFAKSMGITDRKQINQTRVVKLESGKYVTQVSLNNKQGWYSLPGTEATTNNEAEALGGEFLYSSEVADSIRSNHQALESEMKDNQSLAPDALRSESNISTPAEGKYADTGGVITGPDE